jgi:membrane protein DedA with SNARE-associated domain
MSRMHWWQFFLWNALGGIVWATGTALVAYWAGKAAAEAIGRYGLYAVGVLVALGVVAFVLARLWRRRVVESA